MGTHSCNFHIPENHFFDQVVYQRAILTRLRIIFITMKQTPSEISYCPRLWTILTLKSILKFQ